MNAPAARASPPTTTESLRAALPPTPGAAPASTVSSPADRATVVQTATLISSLTDAVKLPAAPLTARVPRLAARVLPIAACGDDALMSQPQ
jgi:hypothetical protein